MLTSTETLPSHFIDLVQDTLLKSFWRKNALLAFLRRHHISENFLSSWQETETKRVFLGRLLPKLEVQSERQSDSEADGDIIGGSSKVP
jgi:hypothetical protein